MLQVLATAEKPHIGGHSFNDRVVQHCIAVFVKEHGLISKSALLKNTVAMQQLRNEVERGKRVLSLQVCVSECKCGVDVVHGTALWAMTGQYSRAPVVASVQL